MAPVFLLLLLAGPVAAQPAPASAPEAPAAESPPPEPGPPAPEDSVSAPPLVAPEDSSPEDSVTAPPLAAPERPSRGQRIRAELKTGALTALFSGLGGAVIGGVAGFVVCSPGGGGGSMNFSGLCPLSGAFVGGAAAAALGFPVGVWRGGERMGGNGWLLGAFAGAGVAAGLIAAAERTHQDILIQSAVLASPLLIVAGYELTTSGPQDAAAATVAPAVGLRTGGASFGLQGSF